MVHKFTRIQIKDFNSGFDRGEKKGWDEQRDFDDKETSIRESDLFLGFMSKTDEYRRGYVSGFNSGLAKAWKERMKERKKFKALERVARKSRR